jgi:hypothetical protein
MPQILYWEPVNSSLSIPETSLSGLELARMQTGPRPGRGRDRVEHPRPSCQSLGEQGCIQPCRSVHTVAVWVSTAWLAAQANPKGLNRIGIGKEFHAGIGGPVGVIVTEEYVCDYCTKRIPNADVLLGRLSLRKQGARGLGREVRLTLHPAMLGQAHRQGHRRRPHPTFP